MSTETKHILFLCTGNSARSIMAEAILNKIGRPQFRGFSAGSKPRGMVHPMTVLLLNDRGYWDDHYHSKSWDVFALPGAPQMDYVITVCDNAAAEVCPVWPGHPATAHWGFADPAANVGSEEDMLAFFGEVFDQIHRKIDMLLDVPAADLDAEAVKARLQAIGAIDLASL